MEYSDEENGSDCEMVDDILGPEDLFNDEIEESEIHNDREEAEDKPEKNSKARVEKIIKQSRIVKNPRVTLNFDTLSGRNGLSALKKLFKNFKFKGNGHEKEDLSNIMGILQQWMCYKLCPSYNFESCMLQLEVLGKKRVVQTLMKKYRLGMDEWSGIKSDEEGALAENNSDISQNRIEFDKLLNEEIANTKSDDELSHCAVISFQNEIQQSTQKETECILTPEQMERINRNRKLAEEKKLQRISAQCESTEVNRRSEIAGSENNKMSRKEALSQFIQQIHGRPVVVKLNSGVDYRGVLACLDGYMNIALEQTEEYVNGQLKNKYGDAFIRGNNVLYISTQKRRI